MLTTLKISKATSSAKDNIYSYLAEFSNGWRKRWIWKSQEEMSGNIEAAEKEAGQILKLINGYNNLPNHLRLDPTLVFRMLTAADTKEREEKDWQNIILSLSAEISITEKSNRTLWIVLGLVSFVGAILGLMLVYKSI